MTMIGVKLEDFMLSLTAEGTLVLTAEPVYPTARRALIFLLKSPLSTLFSVNLGYT